jgi:lipopolysaccharide/colanic/teichoic acid biosynthesis glycosyltransferase
MVDLGASGAAGVGTGLALKSYLLAAVLCACWAGLPRAAERRRPWPQGETAATLRRCLGAVGVLVLVDLVAAKPASQADIVAAVLAALFASMVVGFVVARIFRAAAAAPACQLLVHRQELTGDPAELGADVSARLHRVIGVGDPVAAIALEAAHAGAEEVLILPDAGLSADQLRRLRWQLEEVGAVIRLVTPLASLGDDRVTVRGFGNRLTLDVRPRRLAGTSALVKSWSERLVALAALACAGPVLLLLMAMIRLESEGSPIFKQVRVGKNGRTFNMFKLRSMYVGADQAVHQLRDQNKHGESGVLFKMAKDPRVTRVGALIRRSSLDELPQLVNVVRGEMSLIGPRPALPREVAQYDETAARRLAVLPGLTGLWQVSGRSDLSWKESVELDVEYVENWRPAMDLAIVARTFRAVASARGAY